MKDLYSFHSSEEDLLTFYEQAKEAYLRVFQRCGLSALVVEASGGAFSKYSHEFQVLTDSGEDIIFYCTECGYSQNREISEYKAGDGCPKCGKPMAEGKAIEVGNIFQLKTRFTTAFDVSFADVDGSKKPVHMGCYGIGPSRVMGTVAEVLSDEKGLVWPEEIAPYKIHLIAIPSKDEKETTRILEEAEKIYSALWYSGVSTLYDDRIDVRAGEKFADADLIGIPVRFVISEKTLAEKAIERKERSSSEATLIRIDSLFE